MDFQFQPQQFKERAQRQFLRQQVDALLFCINVFVGKIVEKYGNEANQDEDIEKLKKDLQTIRDKMDSMSLDDFEQAITFLEEALKGVADSFVTMAKEVRIVEKGKGSQHTVYGKTARPQDGEINL